MANGTNTSKKQATKRQPPVRQRARVATARPLRLRISDSILGPTPMEQRLRAAAIRRTRGLLKGKGTLSEHLSWLKKLRTSDREREEEQAKLWKKYRDT
ncbi:MAG: hypothetical protein ABIG71_01600 [Candidatus Uhrbacteria bacterium]